MGRALAGCSPSAGVGPGVAVGAGGRVTQTISRLGGGNVLLDNNTVRRFRRTVTPADRHGARICAVVLPDDERTRSGTCMCSHCNRIKGARGRDGYCLKTPALRGTTW